MSSIFRPGGPPRMRHQKAALRDVIKSKGVHALLLDAGTGKTFVALDYASLLALKSPTGEARVLVIAPLAAVDTWIGQAQVGVADGVSVWAEALGGSTIQKAHALAARGGHPFKGSKRRKNEALRAEGHARALDLALRPASGSRPVSARLGPEGLGEGPRLVLASMNFDSFSSRRSLRGSSRTVADLMVEAVRRFQPDMIVVDESHRIKSPTSNTSRAIARLTPLTRRRLILTGTVMPKDPLDVFGQWRFLDPTAFGTRLSDGSVRPATFSAFRSRFARMGGWMGKEVLGFKNLDEMHEVMGRNSTVVKKKDVLDLPPVTEITVKVNLSPAERRAYREMVKNLAVQVSSGQWSSVPNRLTQLMRLRQITSGYLPDDTGATTVLGTSKVDSVRSIVQDNLRGESRVVVFAHFTDEIEALRAALSSESGTEVQVISGATPNSERMDIRKRFGSSDPSRIILIAQIKTMSLAVNELITSSHAVFASLSQQRDDYLQAVARLDRKGQTRPVTVWNALAPNTVDEVIMQTIKDRSNLEDALLKHVKDSR